MPLFDGIELVFYQVCDMDRSVDFYERVLGLTLVGRAGSDLAQFDVGGAELSLTGELISGQTAYDIGILNHLVPKEEVLAKAMALATDMAQLAPTAMRLTKQQLRMLTQTGFEAALEKAKIAQKEAYASGEPQAAMRRFLDARNKKPPAP